MMGPIPLPKQTKALSAPDNRLLRRNEGRTKIRTLLPDGDGGVWIIPYVGNSIDRIASDGVVQSYPLALDGHVTAAATDEDALLIAEGGAIIRWTPLEQLTIAHIVAQSLLKTTSGIWAASGAPPSVRLLDSGQTLREFSFETDRDAFDPTLIHWLGGIATNVGASIVYLTSDGKHVRIPLPIVPGALTVDSAGYLVALGNTVMVRISTRFKVIDTLRIPNVPTP